MCRASVRAVAALLLAASSSNAYTQRLTAPQSSTDTRVVWPGPEGQTMFESMDEVHRNMTEYLWKNIQPYDIPRAQTLGFRENSVARVSSPDWPRAVGSDAALQTDAGPKEQPCVDGLADGILNQTLHYAIQAKLKYPWSDRIPKDIYLEYVLPFSVVNEPRTDHRTFLFDTLTEVLKDYERVDATGKMSLETAREQIKSAVKKINTDLWWKLGSKDKPIVFKAGLTPRIYDPLSVIAYGYSSCTGLAILLISALRAVGIPCRMAGTPAWNGDEENGNHSWVEVYLPGANGGSWNFLEPSPGIAEGDEDADADDLERDPKSRWFCNRSRMDGKTRVFAARYSRDSATIYPQAWSVGDDGVVGEDRTDDYTSICG